ncbi:hypothetical protein ACTD5D_40820 [Nocardia takedensis]|uniref:hypothetical protein n=1 Tax=Nocardia takedensis TaxID=259390 RepID=UPI003F7695F6
MSVGEVPRTDAELLAGGAAVVNDRLPSTWLLRQFEQAEEGIDATTTVQAPDGRQIKIFVEVKREVRMRDLPRLCEQLARYTATVPGSVGVVVAPHLSAAVREYLERAGLSYVDTTGNLLLRSDAAALFLRDRGADRDPWRGPGRPPATLNGEPAAKIVRALVDVPGPWKIRDLVQTSQASTGSVYRVLKFLTDAELLTRDENGLVAVTDTAALLRRWSRDYQFLHTNTITRWICPRGLPALLTRMREIPVGEYALTGTVAASAWAPYAPARSAMLYAADPEHAAAAWDLRPTDRGPNVLIARPAYPVALERARTGLDGLHLAAPGQVAVDMLTGPGRAPAEAEELLTWMERNERSRR